MLKKTCLFTIISVILIYHNSFAGEITIKSKIISAKIYQNQAKITRQATLSLIKGSNKITVTGLPKLLYDWSIRGSLPKKFNGKILSLEVEKKALIKKRRQIIEKIEKKLDNLREKDQVLLDDLKNIRSQENFLNSILNFTNQTVSKELTTRIPKVKVWDNTLNYVIKKKKALLGQKRKTEKERGRIGKKIQKLEFELSQIAGYSYLKNYQALNEAMIMNRSATRVQQFANMAGNYAKQTRLLTRPTEKIDVEKRAIVNIFSSRTVVVNFTITYLIPNTYWKMLYDIRASNENKKINMFIYANVYQKTGEDWKNISLNLSTGAPVNAIHTPVLNPWYLDIYSYDKYPGRKGKRLFAKKKESYKRAFGEKDEDDGIQDIIIKKKGPYFEAALPLKHTIISSTKYQKKYLKDFKLLDPKKIEFYYELIPMKVRNSFLRVKVENTTPMPWLKGNAQIFLENEFMGKVTIPYTLPGRENDFVLGIEKNITSKKELVKKFEDTSGIFGGNRRILYKYKIIAENRLRKKKEVIILDVIPVSRNKKVNVKIENLSHPFYEDEKFKKTVRYGRGIRKWKFQLNPGQKIEINYDAVITFDKDVGIRGIR